VDEDELLLRDLKLFGTVARRPSFVAAAAELGGSPTFVSKRIAVLEHALGVRLFNRTTRRVGITDDGELVYRWATRILESVEDLTDEIAGLKGEPKGLLRISTSLRLGRNHVAPALALLRARYPGLEVWLETLDRRANLVEEGIHLDIRVGEASEPNLIAHRIAESARVLCAAPSYLGRRGSPRTFADVARHDCLVFRDREEPFGVWRLDGPNGPETAKVTGPMASNHTDIVLGWAHDGHGIVLVSLWDVRDSLRAGKLVRILPEWRQRADVWAVTTARLATSAKVRVCVAFLKEHLTRGPLSLHIGHDA